jgi:hypothetical protein
LLQLLVGFVRPPAARSLTRSLWQLFHALLGRMAVMLGMINVMIGIYLFGTLYKGESGLRAGGAWQAMMCTAHSECRTCWVWY